MTLFLVLTMAFAGTSAPAQSALEYTSGTPVAIANSNGHVSVRGVAGARLEVTAKYLDSGNPAAVDVLSDGGTMRIQPRRDGRGGGGIALDVVLPADARITLVEARSGNVTVSGFTSDVRVAAGSGNVRVADVGSAVVRASSGDATVIGVAGSALVESSSGSVVITGVRGDLTVNCRSGNVSVRDIGGNAEATVGSGNFSIEKVGGAVRAVTISGNVEVDGAGGNANVQTASGNVSLHDIGGSVDATTSSGNAVYRGPLRPGHRYHLKSHSGDAVMELCGNVPGFTVTMQSYSGEIETEFPLTIDRPTTMSRSLTGRFGDGGVEVEVQAFSGSAKLLKCESGK